MSDRGASSYRAKQKPFGPNARVTIRSNGLTGTNNSVVSEKFPFVLRMQNILFRPSLVVYAIQSREKCILIKFARFENIYGLPCEQCA